jgi:hypothetical protein
MQLCPPAFAVLVFLGGIVLYELATGAWSYMVLHAVYLVGLTGGFQYLCYYGYDSLAWVLLAAPLAFFGIMIAIAIVVPGLKCTHCNYSWPSCSGAGNGTCTTAKGKN